MRISAFQKSDIDSNMQLILKENDVANSTSNLHPDRVADWGLRSVSMAEWVELWAPVHAIGLLHPREATGANFLFSKRNGDNVGVRYATGYEMFRHDGPAMATSGGVISVQRIHDGWAAMEFPDANYVHRPDMITITDLKQPYRGSHHHALVEQVLLPRETLGLADADPFSPILIPLESERGWRFARELEQFFGRDDVERAVDRARLGTLLAAVIHDSWSVASDREEWWYGRRNLIRKYIDTHLDDPNLSPVQICELFNMSRATLYRMFEPDGGVRRRIQDRRLHSAIWDLATSGIKRGRLSQVAERWGFSSDANFNRAVKLAYGLPPGALFKTNRVLGLASVGPDQKTQPDHVEPLFESLQAKKKSVPDPFGVAS